jgi:UDP-N-acetylmuramate dehydrogenase
VFELFIFESMEIKENYTLTHLNSFHLKVDAKFFVEVASLLDLAEIREFIMEAKIPYMVLGGGSNILFTCDYEGLLIKNSLKGIEVINEDRNMVEVKVQAGEDWDGFVAYCIDKNWGGLENLSLIPGNVGTCPIQNIGAYGVEMKDHFLELEAMEWESGEIRKFKLEECEFGYRNSIFKNQLKGKYVITSVTFRLDKKHQFNTEYGDIKKELEVLGSEEISIKKVREAVCNIRRRKLPDPDEIGNSGSFFKNPIIPLSQHKMLKIRFPNIVSYPVNKDSVKLAAGWLIDQCGWKGFRKGDAGVHVNQALVLVNYANASGEDILNLSWEIQESVFEKFGVQIEPEVNIV